MDKEDWLEIIEAVVKNIILLAWQLGWTILFGKCIAWLIEIELSVRAIIGIWLSLRLVGAILQPQES